MYEIGPVEMHVCLVLVCVTAAEGMLENRERSLKSCSHWLSWHSMRVCVFEGALGLSAGGTNSTDVFHVHVTFICTVSILALLWHR